MYDNWQIQPWATPVSDVKSLVMVSLVDNGTLKITLEASRLVNRPRWCFEFEDYPVYRNILEQYRMGLWSHLDDTNQRCGWTFMVENSPWLADLLSSEIGLKLNHEREPLMHYVISTEDDVIEILAPSVEITYLGETPADAPVAGKSLVFYNDEDRPQIEQIFQEIVEEQRQFRQQQSD